MVKFAEELLRETKGTRHPRELAGGGGRTGPLCNPQPQEPSEEPGAPSFLSLAFSLLTCS